jgi:hypothetical protein
MKGFRIPGPFDQSGNPHHHEFYNFAWRLPTTHGWRETCVCLPVMISFCIAIQWKLIEGYVVITFIGFKVS